MASQCKRQQCSIDRRGFRQELDSWRHKLIHCVGFESILEGLFGSQLVEDLQLFKDSEPVAGSDWSFDENCLFCCFRRDKVKEHLIGLSSEESLQDPLKPLLVKDQTTISRLEKQAEEFLNAVLSNKDVPSFSDPHIPVVAREILQRMIRQFATEYTSKTSSPQDSSSEPQPSSDQSPQTPAMTSGVPTSSPSAVVAGPVHSHNPVLSKLLMADQDAPLDLTVKKTQSEPSEQEGVLDLSIKKSRHSSSFSGHSPCLSPKVSTLKGECAVLPIAKAKELQSTSTLEQFMAKLCRHHQRQIVDAIGFLQTEVKALGAFKTQQTNNSASEREQGTTCSTPVMSEKSSFDLRIPVESTPKSQILDISCSIQRDSVTENVPETVVPLTSVPASPVLDLHSPESGSNQALVTPTAIPVDADSNRQGDHAPLKMKIMKSSNVAAGKKLSCVLTTSLASDSGTLEARQNNSNLSNRTETHSARLSSSLKRHNLLNHSHSARQRGAVWHTPIKELSLPQANAAESPRTARKTIRPSTHQQTRHAPYRMVDPDLGNCDIVYIDKPITECFKEQQRNLLPRRNARKSTRGHLYTDEIWELKTVRTLAGRGNCPNPMPELITLVTPKQILSKPEGVPPVDMPFAGACRETVSELMSSEESDERVIPGTGDVVEVAANEADIIVETSQTDQCQNKLETPQPIISALSDNIVTNNSTDDLQLQELTSSECKKTVEGHENVAQTSFEAETDKEPEPEQTEPTTTAVSETTEPSDKINTEETELHILCNKMHGCEATPLPTSAPSPMDQGNEKDNGRPQEPPPEKQTLTDKLEETEKSLTSGLVKEQMLIEQESAAAVDAETDVPVSTFEEDEYDVSSKTMDTLLKELPPWRRKRGTVISLPKRLRHLQTVIVGYVNGRPISASDRSLRRRLNSGTSPTKTPVKQSPKVPKKADSPETMNLEANTTEAVVSTESTASAPELPLVAASDITENPTVKISPKSKPIQNQGQKVEPVDSGTETKRQLRSAVQKRAETLPSDLSPNSVTSFSPPKPSLLPASPAALPPVSPLLTGLTSPGTPEQSPLSTVQETVLEVNSQKSQSSGSVSEEVQSISVKQKLRSSKMVVEEIKNETPLDVGLSFENETEMQKRMAPSKGKRVLITEPSTETENPNAASLEERCISSPGVDKPTRMPLRSESGKAETSSQPVPQSPPSDNKKLSLRSQRLSSPSTSAHPVSGKNTNVVSPTRTPPSKTQTRSPPSLATSVQPRSSASTVISPRLESRRQTNKFLEALNGEDNQQLLTDLNLKYEKMQKGWLQMDRDGQPAAKYKNKSDRQAAIWKSKRRARKPKTLEPQKYSPVQMLFTKDFDLSSICRWFLESTETQSLVIVKKINTRLPSETQLCFHSSSNASGVSQGVFPSLQAERLKKHLKKFAIASPVKSNPRSQKLIAKTLEQETTLIKGKERRELPRAAHTNRVHARVDAGGHANESQKSPAKPKNPASARILRKYSNIREKMHVQQTNVRLKGISKNLKPNSLKRQTTEPASESTVSPPQKAPKLPLPVAKPVKATRIARRRTLARRKSTRLRAVEARDVTQVKRCSQRLNSMTDASKIQVDKKTSEVDKDREKSSVNKVNAGKNHVNESPESKEIKSVQGAPEAEVKPPEAPDQVLTRSQRNMKATSNDSSSRVTKMSKMAKQRASLKSIRKAEGITRKAAVKRNSDAMWSRTRAQDLLAPPAKRTRMSR
ncbi:mucin-2 isoform X1 [Dunckerocampus dactyliophorus]|uniref:mucin-2 isoform X1 n=1 Tax=Dunckerocampus dactyliophorus TaxID=161453 RepID=UPI0024049128|nr:mucin-2 isoform X1 [Dunckerocampus dactyliophorus]